MGHFRSILLLGLMLALLLPIRQELVPVTVGRAAPFGDPISLGPDRGWINALALSPQFQTDGQVWAAPFGGRIFASRDGGDAWNASADGETDPVVTGLAASPLFAQNRTVYAAADDGVFRSRDAGNTWSNLSAGLGGHFVRGIYPLAQSPIGPALFATTDAGVYLSTDDADTWLAPAGGAVAVASFAAGPGGFYAGPTGGGLLRSQDGRAWSVDASFSSDRQVLALATVGDRILAGTNDGIWTSLPTGGWRSAGLDGDRITTMVVAQGTGPNDVAFASSASGDGIFESEDGGLSWQRVGSPPFPYVQVLAPSPGFQADRTVFAGTAGAGVAVSHDGGATWRPASAGLHAAQVAAVRLSQDGVTEAGNGGLSNLPPGASTWQDLAAPSRFITSFDRSANDLFLGTQDAGLQVSRDGGLSWSRTPLSVAPPTAVRLSPSFQADGTAIAACGYVYVSQDGGAHWQQATGMVGNDVRRFSYSPTFGADHTVFAATITHRVYRSTDGGLTWSREAQGLPSDQINDVLASPGFSRDGTVYAATAGDGIYRSTDRGETWAPVSPQPPQPVVTALEPTVDGSIAVGTEKGLFLWSASGFDRLGGAWDGYVTDLQAVPAGDGETVFAGTLGSGVWRFDQAANPTPPAPPAATPPTLVPPPPPETAVPRPTAKPTPGPTRTGATIKLKLSVYPSPLVARQPGLLVVRGTASSAIQVRMSAGSWKQVFTDSLPRDGQIGFGFLAPTRTLSAFVTASLGGHVVTASIAVKVKAH